MVSWATGLVSGLGTLVVGAVVGEAVARFRKLRQLKLTDRQLLGEVAQALQDDPGSPLRPARPGLLRRVEALEAGQRQLQRSVEEAREKLGQLDQKIDQVIVKLSPNGGDSNEPGDVVTRVESKLDELLQALRRGKYE